MKNLLYYILSKILFSICLIHLLLLGSCSHLKSKQRVILLKDKSSIIPPKSYDFSDLSELDNYLEKQKKYSNENQNNLIQLLRVFEKMTHKIDENIIQIMPYSSIKIQLSSFCIIPNKAIPEKNEVFKWIKKAPDIPYMKEIIIKFNNNSLFKKKDLFQELIWNLANKTYYEDYTKDLKDLLNIISPKAKFNIPSRLKNNLIKKILPESIKDSISIIEGKYYSFKEFHDSLSNLKSNISINKNYYATNIPYTKLYAKTKSNGFKSQTITIFNKSNKTEEINLTAYHLEPLRNDVQSIMLASIFNYDLLFSKLKNEALGFLSYLGSKYPTLNNYEKVLVRKKPIEAAIVFWNMIIVERECDKRFPIQIKNGSADAFRHFVWSAMLVRDIGETDAREFLLAHEKNQDQPYEEMKMDEFNNEQGIKFAIKQLKINEFDNEEIINKALEKIEKGDLKIIESDLEK